MIPSIIPDDALPCPYMGRGRVAAREGKPGGMAILLHKLSELLHEIKMPANVSFVISVCLLRL